MPGSVERREHRSSRQDSNRHAGRNRDDFGERLSMVPDLPEKPLARSHRFDASALASRWFAGSDPTCQLRFQMAIPVRAGMPGSLRACFKAVLRKWRLPGARFVSGGRKSTSPARRGHTNTFLVKLANTPATAVRPWITFCSNRAGPFLDQIDAIDRKQHYARHFGFDETNSLRGRVHDIRCAAVCVRQARRSIWFDWLDHRKLILTVGAGLCINTLHLNLKYLI